MKKPLNLGSSCIYPGNISPHPIKESDLLSGPLEKTNEAYAVAKIAVIKLCHYYNQQYGTNFISAMPTNQYGSGDNFNMETAHLLPMVMRRFHLAKLLASGDEEGLTRDLARNPLGWGLDARLRDGNRQEILAKLVCSRTE
ncbi:MAG: NAD-dependent epimerase/dehydratase family protein [Rickettsiales bacterium]|nr:NAD-dependent epimerase/dehydratase family protein [Rickettsiales bacterium]